MVDDELPKAQPNGTTDGVKAPLGNPGGTSPLSDPLLFSSTGRGLRAIFIDSLREPVPKTILAILSKLHSG